VPRAIDIMIAAAQVGMVVRLRRPHTAPPVPDSRIWASMAAICTILSKRWKPSTARPCSFEVEWDVPVSTLRSFTFDLGWSVREKVTGERHSTDSCTASSRLWNSLAVRLAAAASTIVEMTHTASR
jgi:hypothetical protein